MQQPHPNMEEWNCFLRTLDESSKLKYQRCVADYLEYCQQESNDVPSPMSVLKHLRYLHAPDDDGIEEGESPLCYATSTLWSVASILGRFLLKAYGISGVTQKNGILASELAQWEKDETVKQAKVFTKDDIATFLNEGYFSFFP
jgi:hypothetical protein